MFRESLNFIASSEVLFGRGSLAGKLTVFITTFSPYVDNQFILQMFKNFYLGSIVSGIVHYWLCDSH